MLLVEGTIVFGDDFEAFQRAIVRVRLENVTRLDAAATSVAEAVIPVVRKDSAARSLSFAIHGDALDPRARYGVRAHVDVDRDGRVGIGDYVSTASHPVHAAALPAKVSIPVRRVISAR